MVPFRMHLVMQAQAYSAHPSISAIRVQDTASDLSGCRSPTALHLETGGDTPNPFGSPNVSMDGPPAARSPPAQAAAQSRLRAQRSNTSSLATRALSSLNPARASGVIGNIFGGSKDTSRSADSRQ